MTKLVRIEIAELEAARLIRLALHRTLSMDFGGNRLWLKPIPENLWAYEALMEMRKASDTKAMP